MNIEFFPPDLNTRTLEAAGFRFGDRGTHTSRTMMLADLTATLAAAADETTRAGFVRAIVENNCLGKPTAATRVLSAQRLTELYALDPQVPIFRVLGRVWNLEPDSQPLFALLIALARDPLLAATTSAIIPLAAGAEFTRGPMRAALRTAVGDRLNDATLDKVVRNAASTWSQSGHLVGRTFKVRHWVNATPAVVALAMFLAFTAGFRGEAIATSGWVKVLDAQPRRAWDLATDAKRLGLLDLRQAGDVVDLDFDRLNSIRGAF
jgi:hypothetical protein